MQKVILGLGSNVAPARHLSQAVGLLRREYLNIELSPIYETQAVGFVGANFWNVVAGINTDLTLEKLKENLRALEFSLGRPQRAQRWADRCIDIDILSYGSYRGLSPIGYLPRADILKHAYVLAPLADLYPSLIHEETGHTFLQHWMNFAGDRSAIIRKFSHELISAATDSSVNTLYPLQI